MKAIVIIINAENGKFLEIIEGKILFNKNHILYRTKQVTQGIEIDIGDGFLSNSAPQVMGAFDKSFMVVYGLNRQMDRHEIWYIIPKGY